MTHFIHPTQPSNRTVYMHITDTIGARVRPTITRDKKLKVNLTYTHTHTHTYKQGSSKTPAETIITPSGVIALVRGML